MGGWTCHNSYIPSKYHLQQGAGIWKRVELFCVLKYTWHGLLCLYCQTISVFIINRKNNKIHWFEITTDFSFDIITYAVSCTYLTFLWRKWLAVNLTIQILHRLLNAFSTDKLKYVELLQVLIKCLPNLIWCRHQRSVLLVFNILMHIYVYIYIVLTF